MKKVATVLALAGLLALTTGSAFGFSLANNYTGPLEIKFSDWSTGALYDQSSGGYGQQDGTADSYGIFKIFTFKDLVGNTLWADGLTNPEELTGVYYDMDDDFWSVTPDGLGGFDVNIQAVGGKIDIYLDDSKDFDPTKGPVGAHETLSSGGSTYDTVTDGDLFLSLEFVPGIKFNNGNPADDHITYDNNLDGTTSPFTGDGAFYMNVLGGTHAWLFDSDYITLSDDSGNVSQVDMFAQFDTVAPGSFGWLVNSEDPVRAFAVPEPISMTTFGMGLLGFLGIGLKKKKAIA